MQGTREQIAHYEQVTEEINVKIMDMLMSYDNRVLASFFLYHSAVLLNNLVSGGVLSDEATIELINETYADVLVKRQVRTVMFDPTDLQKKAS